MDRAARTPSRLGTVLLAACATHIAGRSYDASFSLSTAFLVAGARSVIGSLWAVQSASTGVLMYELHRQLTAAGLDPAAALRQAQLWMLDPDRPVDGLPEELTEGLPLGGLADPYRWAGFAHLGR
jgi:CHAT domain-containing protein